MKKITTSFIILIFLLGIVSAQTELPNPASVKCEDDGYNTETRFTEKGSYGVCIFKDSECGQWDYFNKKCKPEQCSKVEGYLSNGEFKIKCEPYKKENRFSSLFKKYFFLIFAWLWIEEESKDTSSFEKALNEDGPEM